MGLLLLIGTAIYRNWTLCYLLFPVANGLIEAKPRRLNCKANSSLQLISPILAVLSTCVMLDLRPLAEYMYSLKNK